MANPCGHVHMALEPSLCYCAALACHCPVSPIAGIGVYPSESHARLSASPLNQTALRPPERSCRLLGVPLGAVCAGSREAVQGGGAVSMGAA